VKKSWFLFLFLLSFSCQRKVDRHGLDHMTPELWEEDIDYINKRIQREFASFDPTIKSKFGDKALALKRELSTIGNSFTAIKIGQLLASLGDGHTEMSILQEVANFGRLPLAMYFFEEGLYILATDKRHEDYIGRKVLKIGNKTVLELFELLKTVMTYDNQYEILHAGPTFLLSPEILAFLHAIGDEEHIELTLENEESVAPEFLKLQPITLNEYKNTQWVTIYDVNNMVEPLRRKNRGQDYWFEYLHQERTMYFNFSKNNNQKKRPSIKETVSQMFKSIDQVNAEKLIIDLRANRGGNYKKSRPLINAIKKHPQINQKNKLYVITGRTTFSAAMVTSIFLKRETNATLIGEPSRGHPNKTDNVEYMTLPHSKLSIEYTTKVKRHWVELGDLDHVPVDVEIKPQFRDYEQGIDAELKFVLEH